MQCAVAADTIALKRARVLKLLACEGQALVLGWGSFLVEDLGLDRCDGVTRLHIQRDCVAAEGPHEKLKEQQLRVMIHCCRWN